MFSDRLKSRIRKIFTRTNCDIFTQLVRANLKVNEYNSFLGIAWTLLGPAVLLTVLYFVFSKNFGQDIKAYPLYILVGVVCVNFFTTATNNMVGIFSANREFVLNSTISREILLASTLALHVYKIMIDLCLCLILSIFYGCLTWKFVILITPLLVAFIFLVSGINMILSLLSCFAGDVEYIWMLVMRLLYFATPIFYSIKSVHPLVRKAIYFGNPLASFVISFQGIFMGNLDIASYLYSIFLGILFFIFGCRVFILIENAAIEQV